MRTYTGPGVVGKLLNELGAYDILLRFRPSLDEKRHKGPSPNRTVI